MAKTVALLIFPGVQSLDVSGPLDVFAEANRFLQPQDQYRLEIIGLQDGRLPCSNGMLLQAHRHYKDVDDHYDLLLIPGGPGLMDQEFEEGFFIWLRAASERACRFGSICNGALILGRAGLLDGRRVTTHWNDAAALAKLCPTTHVEPDRLFIRDGSLYTSAGVTAGIDLSLYLLSGDHGPEVALNVAKRLVVFMQRSGGQSQFSPFLTPYVEAASPVAQVQQYVLSHMSEDLSVSVLAKVACMSERNFSRTFVKDTKITPAEFVEGARIDKARVMLESGTAPLKTIAYECGLRDAHHLRAVFKRRMGVTPQQYRLHFSAPA